MLRQISKLKKGQRLNYYIESRIMDIEENNNFILRRIETEYEKLLKIFEDLEIEALISPGLVTPAVKIFSSKENDMQCFYTVLFNLFNLPAGVVPVSKVKENEQFYEDNINDQFTKSFKEQMENSTGLPVGVHISALCWNDEKVFDVMEIIEKYVDFWKS
jgi:fatty acid amide hydrolase